MVTDSFVILLLVALLGALAWIWARIRYVEHEIDRGGRALADVERAVRNECLPAVNECTRRVTTALDRLDAERAAADAEVAKAQQGLAPLVEDLAKAASQLGEVRVELARLIDRAGTRAAAEEPLRPSDGAWLRDLVRTHLIGLGIGSITVDGTVQKPDGSWVVRARGLRGSELWSGSVVVRGGKVESEARTAARMFP